MCFHRGMSRRRPNRAFTAALLLGLALPVALTACTAVQQGRPGDAETRASEPPRAAELPSEAAVESAVADALQGTGVPGAAVLVTNEAGDERLVVQGESREGARAEAEDVFAYRSVTKSFVGTVVLQLVEEGRVSLDAPVSDYVSGVPDGDSITIGQLGTMRSGLPNYSAAPGFGELLVEDPAREPDVSELLAVAFAAPQVFPPGTAYEYSNTNTLLLGEVIEAVTGDPWMTAVQQRIVVPLGLESVSYGFPMSDTDAAGHRLERGAAVEELPVVAPGWFGAAGGLVGDVRDLAVWGRALGSGALLEPETQELRLSLLGPVDDDPASPVYDRYGFAIGEAGGWIGHSGSGLGFQSLAMHDPTSGHTVAILLNGTGEDPDLPIGVFDSLLELFEAG